MGVRFLIIEVPLHTTCSGSRAWWSGDQKWVATHGVTTELQGDYGVATPSHGGRTEDRAEELFLVREAEEVSMHQHGDIRTHTHTHTHTHADTHTHTQTHTHTHTHAHTHTHTRTHTYTHTHTHTRLYTHSHAHSPRIAQKSSFWFGKRKTSP